MRENRMCGSEGGEPGSTRLPYPYRGLHPKFQAVIQRYRFGLGLPPAALVSF